MCEFRDDLAVTVIGHSTLGKLLVARRGQFSEVFNLRYDESVTTDQLLELVTQSQFCQQELTYVHNVYVTNIGANLKDTEETQNRSAR